MSRFLGYGKCSVCSVGCTSGNYVDHAGVRYCSACWIEKENPDHPDLEKIREAVQEAAKKWKRQKYSREDGPLPIGPYSHRN